MDNEITFSYQGELLRLVSVSNITGLDNISTGIKESVANIYNKCFSSSDPDTLMSLYNFSKDKGATILINNRNDECYFLVTLVKNKETGYIEIFNVCKNFHQNIIRSYDILVLLIDYFIKDNPLFKGYEKIRLAILCDNPYLIPAFKTYCRLGFSVEDQVMPVLSMLTNYVTMSRRLYISTITPTNFSDQLKLLIMRCKYKQQEISKLLENIKL